MLLGEFQETAKSYSLTPGFYYMYDKDAQDLLLPYYLNTNYAEEPEDYIRSGWAVIAGEPDFSKNLFTGEKFDAVFAILDEVKERMDAWLDAMVAEVFGEEYAHGW